jgi:hypothetical protein
MTRENFRSTRLIKPKRKESEAHFLKIDDKIRDLNSIMKFAAGVQEVIEINQTKGSDGRPRNTEFEITLKGFIGDWTIRRFKRYGICALSKDQLFLTVEEISMGRRMEMQKMKRRKLMKGI